MRRPFYYVFGHKSSSLEAGKNRDQARHIHVWVPKSSSF